MITRYLTNRVRQCIEEKRRELEGKPALTMSKRDSDAFDRVLRGP
ncbi:MAG: hypothetical protein Q6373_018300 [Candidatus Sigynarchaeota archaeon]